MTASFLSDPVLLSGSNSAMLLLAKATIILVGALLVTLAMQRSSAGARHLVWLVALGALMLVPAVAAWSPLQLGILPAARNIGVGDALAAGSKSRQSVTSAQVTSALPTDAGAVIPKLPSTTDSPASTAFASIGGISGVSLLVILWAAVVLCITASLGYASLAVRRITRRSTVLESQDWLTPLWEISDRIGLEEPPRLLRSADTKMPFACGVLRPTVVLPAECDDWTADRRRAVLLHELAHVRRHDLAGHTLGRLVCAVYWFHPLVWTAAKRLRSESERACDDLALACGARATDYAEHLLEIVTSVRRDSTPSVALAMARRKEFEGRMLAILDPELRRSSPTRRQSSALIGSLAVISLLVSAAAPVPRKVDNIPMAQRDSTDSVNVLGDGSSFSSVVTDDVEEPDDDTSPQISAGAKASVAVAPLVSTDVDGVTTVVMAESLSALGGVLKGPDRNADAPADDRPLLLAKVLRSDTSENLRRVAAWGLTEYADTQVGAEALAQALRRDASAAVREMAAWALANGDEGNQAASDALGAALRSDASVQVRATAAWALGNVGDRASADVLTAALGDASAEVRRRAAWALGNVEPRQAPRPLLAMLGDPDPRTRELAAWVVYQIEDPGSIPALEAALARETNKDLQIDYLRALAALGDKSVDAIKKLLESPDARIKSMAVRALAGGNASGPWPWPWPLPRPYP